ncbi:MAG: hypothetical protein ACRD1Y_11805 [Terriglobales bacterium]
MAELAGLAPEVGEQFRAILGVRWQLMRNGMRTTRGALEAVSQAWLLIWFTILGLGGAVGFAFGGWHFIRNGEAIWLSVLLWPLFLFWQIFPIAGAAFSERQDLRHLARYPLALGPYCLLRVIFGSADVANIVGALCTCGLLVGILLARPVLAPVAVVAALLFFAFNLLLSQMIAAWLERWLAKRRTREILTVVFFAVIIGVNFVGPITRHWSHVRQGAAAAHLPLLLPLASWLPPGLWAEALASVARGRLLVSLGALVLLAVCAVVVFALLRIRLRAEYFGEVVTDAVAPAAPARPAVARLAPPHRRGLEGPVAAVAEKEFGYIRRSPYMFFTLAMPIVILLLFAVGGFSGGGGGMAQAARYAYPIGLGYALITFTNLVFNVCGADAGGVQLYFVTPVRFRQVLEGKNLAHAVLLAIEAAILYAVVWLLHSRPPAVILAATLLGFVFAVLCAFTAGNLISLYMPKKMDLARVGRHAARGASSLIAMAVQGGAMGLAVLAMIGGFALHQPWVGLLIIFVLSVLAAVTYVLALRQTDHIALARREALMSELCKA